MVRLNPTDVLIKRRRSEHRHVQREDRVRTREDTTIYRQGERPQVNTSISDFYPLELRK